MSHVLGRYTSQKDPTHRKNEPKSQCINWCINMVIWLTNTIPSTPNLLLHVTRGHNHYSHSRPTFLLCTLAYITQTLLKLDFSAVRPLLHSTALLHMHLQYKSHTPQLYMQIHPAPTRIALKHTLDNEKWLGGYPTKSWLCLEIRPSRPDHIDG